MYFPYLRGRQSELNALIKIAPGIGSTKRLIPIIEPLDKYSSLLTDTIKACNFYKIPFVLIVNPQVSLAKNPPPALVENQIGSGQLRLEGEAALGYLIHAGTQLPEVKQFLKTYSARPVAFIHDHSFTDRDELVGVMESARNIRHQIFIEGRSEYSYQRAFANYNRVLIRDGFNKATTNADFPADEFFSDLHLRYRNLGFDGFGDFTITGRKFVKGGIPYAVAVHLTYYNNSREALRIQHFISDRVVTRDDPAGKFLEALVKLIDFLNNNPQVQTGASDEFRVLYSEERFPGLPEIKYLSIRHHLELLVGLVRKK
jgi:hypothetical protein